jgi:phosphoribosylformylglycinamidine synthase subunit PurL
VALASEGLASSAHDVSDGGLATALAECCFLSAGLGAAARLAGAEPAEAALFGERGARAVISAPARALARIRAVAAQYEVSVRELGLVGQEEFRIEYNGAAAVAAGARELRDLWAEGLARALAHPLPANE